MNSESLSAWAEGNFGPKEVRRAIAGVCAKLGRSEDVALQEAFDAGLHPNILTYGKLGVELPSLPIIDRYLVGATSFLHQPSNYYDIFRACRCVYVVQLLDAALETLLRKKTRGTEERMQRLVREMEHDGFDAALFELVTAARYVEHPDVSGVEFISESPGKKTPDFLVQAQWGGSCVECKKVDRNQNFTIEIRNAARDLLNGVIERFRSKGLSVLAEVTFNCDPLTLKPETLADASCDALQQRTPIIESDFTVKAALLPRFRSSSYTLYPSAKFNWERYGYRVRGEWFGVVQQLFGSRAVRAGLPAHLRGGMSSWINEIDWDAALKWKISSEDVLARYRRFAFDSVFNGLAQIKNFGGNSTVHVWLETEYSVGARQDALVNLLGRLLTNPANQFGWIVINETLFDISPQGRFDLIEHGHFIRGPTAVTPEAPVCGVFADEIPHEGGGEFGLGRELPDIDELP